MPLTIVVGGNNVLNETKMASQSFTFYILGCLNSSYETLCRSSCIDLIPNFQMKLIVNKCLSPMNEEQTFSSYET